MWIWAGGATVLGGLLLWPPVKLSPEVVVINALVLVLLCYRCISRMVFAGKGHVWHIAPSSIEKLGLLDSANVWMALLYAASSLTLLGTLQFFVIVSRLLPDLWQLRDAHAVGAQIMNAFPADLELNMTNGELFSLDHETWRFASSNLGGICCTHCDCHNEMRLDSLYQVILPLSAVESVQLGLIWRVCRQAFNMPDVDVMAPAIQLPPQSPSVPTPVAVGSSKVGVGTKRVKVAQIADQLDDTELELIEKKEVDEAYRTFRELTGSDPPSDSEPTAEQLTVMHNKIVVQGDTPYADFSVLTPFGRRMQKQLKAKGYFLQEDGTFKQTELPGPASYSSWHACWKIYRVILLMLRHLPNNAGDRKPIVTMAALEEYHECIAKLCRDFPECWSLVMKAEDRCRGVFTFAARDEAYWTAEETGVPEGAAQAMGTIKIAHNPPGMQSMATKGDSKGSGKGTGHPKKYGKFFVTDRDGNQIWYRAEVADQEVLRAYPQRSSSDTLNSNRHGVRKFRFAEFFAGLSGFTNSLKSLADDAVEITASLDGYAGQWDILDDAHFEHSLQVCNEFDHGHFGPACRTFTRARRSDEHGHVKLLRTDAHPEGFGDDEATLANRMVERVIALCLQLHQRGATFAIENPEDSLKWLLPKMQKLFKLEGSDVVLLHQCAYGAASRKPTCLVTTSEWMKSVCSLCDDVRHHLHARGGLVGKAWDYVAEEWVWRTSLAAEYPCGLCVAWSRALLSWLNSASGKRWVERRTMVKLGKWNNTLVRGDLVRQGAPTHSLEAPATHQSSRDLRERENLHAIGGLRNPRHAVKKSPKLRDVGSRIRQILDSMSWDAQLDRLEADFTAGLEDTWVSELRAKLADAFAVATVDSGLQAPLWSAMLRDAADPDAKVLAKWLAEGFPLGIQEAIENTGIFPKTAEDSAAIEASRLQGVLQGDADGTIVNYTSFEEAGEKAQELLDKLNQAGRSEVFDSWEAVCQAVGSDAKAVAHDGESSAVCYVDDPLMFIIGRTARLRLLGFLRYVALWTALGLDIAWNKACRGCRVVWIGFEILLHQPKPGDMMVQLTQAKRDKLLSVFDQIAQYKGVFPLKLLQYAAGVLGWVSSVMPLARPYLAMIWAAITQHRTPMRDTTRIRKGLVFIRQVEGALKRCFRWRPSAPVVLIQTDACPTGMGGFLKIGDRFAAWWADDVMQSDLETFHALKGDPTHQNEWELLAVWCSLEVFSPMLEQLSVKPQILLRTDNTSTLQAALEHRASSPLLVALAAEIALSLEVRQLMPLWGQHVPTQLQNCVRMPAPSVAMPWAKKSRPLKSQTWSKPLLTAAVEPELPPAVAAARAELGLPALAHETATSASGAAESVGATLLSAGDEPLRTRRGSSELALEVASSQDSMDLARRQFKSLIYASSTVCTKESLFGLWEKLCARLNYDSLPVTEASIFDISSVLRAAGFRAVSACLYEAKARHVRAGFAWSPQLDAVLQDAKRGARRAIGDANKAAEIRPAWWASLARNFGSDPCPHVAGPKSPVGGVALWVFATAFLLRETELAYITLDSQSIKLDYAQRTVSLHLSVQKNDPAARGAWRTLACECTRTSPCLCPFHVADDLVCNQLSRVGHTRLEDVPPGAFPLVGQRACPSKVVDKKFMIDEAQRLASLIMIKLSNPAASQLEITTVTGHFARRSGAKELARRGIPLSTIQWMARHSSLATLGYVEEAWAENPRESFRCIDASSISDMIQVAVGRISALEEAQHEVCAGQASLSGELDRLEAQLLDLASESLQVRLPSDLMGQMRTELRKMVTPIGVLNTRTKFLHHVDQRTCILSKPDQWICKCGWKFMSSCNKELFFDDDELPEGAAVCDHCLR
ncbi:Kcnh1, partial [Symbiodinium necroappetens]